MFRRLRTRLDALVHRGRFRRELEEEIAFHIDRLTEELIRRGMDPKEARREARLRFGSTERVQASSREARGLAVIDELARNARFALRSMTRAPLFSATFILTLALCVGLGTGVFSVVDAVLWRPLPYPEPDHLAQAILYDPSFGKTPGNTAVDGQTWERIRDEGQDFERAVYSSWIAGVNLSTDATSAYVQQQRVGVGYFRTLGLLPRMGREFSEAEDVPGGPPVAILSHELWARTFGSDPDIVGSSIRLKGKAHTVVGVMPADFESQGDVDVWTPLQASTSGEGGGANYVVLIRFPSRMSFEEADARLASIRPPGGVEEGESQRRLGLVPFGEAETAGIRPTLMVVLGAIGLMLLVGWANLAGLRIAGSVARRTELATRQALGSGSGALVRQMVTENLLLGLLGGLAGLLVTAFTIRGLDALSHSFLSGVQPVALDGRALLAGLVLTLLATVFFGLVPVLQAMNPAIQRTLVTGSRSLVGGGSHRLRKALLVGQVAMVTALLFAAGLLVRSYGHLEGLDPGFDPDGVLTVQFSLDDARYSDADSVRTLFSETLAGIRRVPGVSAAAVSLTLPYERPLNLPFRLPGDDTETIRVTNAVYVTPGFFETLGIPLLRGRRIQESDREGMPIVAVANQAFVESNLEDRSAIGTPVTMGFGGAEGVEIVGVVGNVQQSAGWGDTSQPVWETPTLYLPAAQASSGFLQQVHVWFSPSWLIRSPTSSSDVAARIPGVFAAVDPELPVARTATLTQVMNDAFAEERFEAAFLIAVAAFALLLAGIGLHGIVVHEILERRTETGLRMAMGATPGQAVWTAGARGLRLVLAGLALGSVLAVLLARVIGHLVYGIAPYDPLTLGAILGVLSLLTAGAAFLPAARVGRMDPADVLRQG